MEAKKYRSVSLRRELIQQIDEIVKENSEYSTIADFVNEAIRLRIQQLKSRKKLEV